MRGVWPERGNQSFRAHGKVCSDRHDVARCLSSEHREAPTGKRPQDVIPRLGFLIAEEAEGRLAGPSARRLAK
jgi:hypothetical protein